VKYLLHSIIGMYRVPVSIRHEPWGPKFKKSEMSEIIRFFFWRRTSNAKYRWHDSPF